MGKFNLQFGASDFMQGIGGSPYVGGVASDGVCDLSYKDGLLAPPSYLYDSDLETDIAGYEIVAYAKGQNSVGSDLAMCVGSAATGNHGQMYTMALGGGGEVTASGATDEDNNYSCHIFIYNLFRLF